MMQLSMVDAHDDAVEQLHALTAIYTRDHVVEDVLNRIGWPRRLGRLLDPSCGDGAFVVAALQRLSTPPDDFRRISRVQGMEIYPDAVRETHERVKSLLVSRGWSHSSATLAAFRTVHRCDFLMHTVDHGAFSMLVGNPPYLRFGNLPDEFKGIYSGALPSHARGDLLHAFLDRCCSILPDDGVVGFVTADRWLFNETASELRRMLGSRVGLNHVSRLDPSSSFYRPKNRVAGTPPRIHPVCVVLTADRRKSMQITAKPISPDGQLAVEGKTFADIATIRIAPWVGPDGIFVVDAETAANFPESQIVPCVDTDDIDSETDALHQPKRYVIRVNSEPTGPVRDHILRRWPRMPRRGQREQWWLPPESVYLDLSKPSLLIPRIAKRLRVIRLPAGILPINHNLQVVSHADLEYVESVLKSGYCQDWIANNAPRLEGGYLSITTKLLRRMPVP